MSKIMFGVNERQDFPFSDSVESVRLKHQQQAQQLLDAYNNGDPHAVEKFIAVSLMPPHLTINHRYFMQDYLSPVTTPFQQGCL